jgi:PIN domain nuclease of toxin-antitoxin system
LALVKQEIGADVVAARVADEAAISAINVSEVVAKLDEAGTPADEIVEVIDALRLEIVDFDVRFAYRAGLLRSVTRSAGLSLGDRACLALAVYLKLPAVTADRRWADLNLDIQIELIR